MKGSDDPYFYEKRMYGMYVAIQSMFPMRSSMTYTLTTEVEAKKLPVTIHPSEDSYVLVNVESSQLVDREDSERTAANKRIFLEKLEASGGKAYIVAQYLKIGYSTYHYWRKVDPLFNQSVKEILNFRPEWVEQSLMGKALEGDVSAAKYILSHKHPEYMPQKKTEDNSVHIYYHQDKKPDAHTVSFEDILDNPDIFRVWMEESKKDQDKRIDK